MSMVKPVYTIPESKFLTLCSFAMFFRFNLTWASPVMDNQFMVVGSTQFRSFGMTRIQHLGAWGQTVFSLKKSNGLEGDKLILQQRDRNMAIGEAEILAILAISEAFGMKANSKVVEIIKAKQNATG
jgi:hypothetical protein